MNKRKQYSHYDLINYIFLWKRVDTLFDSYVVQLPNSVVRTELMNDLRKPLMLLYGQLTMKYPEDEYETN